MPINELLTAEEAGYMKVAEKLRARYSPFMACVESMEDCYFKRVLLKLRELDKATQGQQRGLDNVALLFRAAECEPGLFLTPGSAVHQALKECYPTDKEKNLLRTRRSFMAAALSAPFAGAGIGYAVSDDKTKGASLGAGIGLAAVMGLLTAEEVVDKSLEQTTPYPLQNDVGSLNEYLLDRRALIAKQDKVRAI